MRYLVIAAAYIAAAAASADVVQLAESRLALMREVAAHKFLQRQPVEDLAREARVLQAAEAAALTHGLRVDDVRALFAAQIEAAKLVQGYWFARWSERAAPTDALDLDTELRPRLIALGDETLAALAAQGCCAPGATIRVEGLEPSAADRVVTSLRAVARYSDRLAQVLQSGIVRVGTTGDYAPFSFRATPDKAFVGADIDLAQNLARSLDATVQFVPTTWPSLMQDLAARRFDIAMSGVSRTLARQRAGYFTSAYHVGGKTPIARCADADRYPSIEAINRPEVAVIVNPGGTNERFVDTRLPRAQKVVHADNRSIFERLAAGDADVMVTDRIEVTLQAARHPGALCPTTDTNFTHQEKAYLLPQDDPWRAYVDAWLAERLSDGTVAAALSRHTAP